MAILTHYDINRFMYPLTHCNDLDKEQKEIILKYACETIEHMDEYLSFTGVVSYRNIEGKVIAELKTNGYNAIEGQYRLVKFNGVKDKTAPTSNVISKYWDTFRTFRANTLLEGFDVLRKFVNDDEIKRLREKAYYCISYCHYSAYEYEMEGYNDRGVKNELADYFCRDLYKNYYYYDDKFDLILNFAHYYNKGEMKIIKNTILSK